MVDCICQKPIVLIVDDVPKNLQILGIMLKDENVEIAAAVNGRQALDFVRKIKPDLILLDVMMPEMDGYETIRQLKSEKDTADIPVIFLTARTETEDIIEGLKLGAADYIIKPFNSVELLARVRNHLELKSSRDALKVANATKDKFFSIISHDLRTPFAVMIGFSEYLISHFGQMKDEARLELYHDILSVAQRSHQLFENLLQWASSQTGRIEFRSESLNLKRVTEESLDFLKGRAKEKEIEISIRIPGDMTLTADKNMLDAIIRNLTTNAIKFTKTGGRIEISAEQSDHRVKLCVSDNGIGISKEVQKKLFCIDEHVTTPGTSREEGAGLGLILVKEFVDRHGGSIHVESEEGKGCRFDVFFPIALN